MAHSLAQLIIEGTGTSDSISIPGTGTAFDGAQIGQIVGSAMGYVFAAAGIGLLLMIISSGFTLMTSAGDAKKMAAGQQRLTNAIIGFLLVFGAFWIVQILGVILGWETYIGDVFGR